MKEEKMNVKEVKKKKIQKLRKLISFGEIIILVVPMLIFLLSMTMAVLTVLSGEELEISTIIQEVIGAEEETTKTNEEIGIKTGISVIASFVGYIIYILIYDKIKKIFINIEKEGTLFTDENIILLTKIKKLVLISFFSIFLGNQLGIGLFPVIIVLSLVFVFEHGCELQKEVDETL